MASTHALPSLTITPTLLAGGPARWMTYHKSLALCVAFLLPARIAVKLVAKAPALEGSAVEQMAGKLSHVTL